MKSKILTVIRALTFIIVTGGMYGHSTQLRHTCKKHNLFNEADKKATTATIVHRNSVQQS